VNVGVYCVRASVWTLKEEVYKRRNLPFHGPSANPYQAFWNVELACGNHKQLLRIDQDQLHVDPNGASTALS
jgi:hypothetical protein